MKRYSSHALLFVCLLTGLLSLSKTSARADLLLSPTGGKVLFNDKYETDDAVYPGRSLGFTGTFFGQSYDTVDVSLNGNLNFTLDPDYLNTPFPSDGYQARIAPLWDDLIIRPHSGGQIVETVVPGISYAVTWQNMDIAPGLGQKWTFQAAWFGSFAVRNGYLFRPDDIVFSYAQLGSSFADDSGGTGATVGLDAGDYTTATILPGTTDGLVLPSTLALLPTERGSFVLFRPDGAGGYTVTVETGYNAVPEPGMPGLFVAAVVFVVLCRAGSSRKTRRLIRHRG